MQRAMTAHYSRRVRPRSIAEPVPIPQTVVGTVATISPEGKPMVSFRGVAPPVVARYLAGAWPAGSSLANLVSREVLLAFDGGDALRPIIIGLLAAPADAATPEKATVKGTFIDLRGEKEMTLRCGKSSMTLRQDGKIIIRGTHLLSRATGPIRIKGGHVEIN